MANNTLLDLRSATPSEVFELASQIANIVTHIPTRSDMNGVCITTDYTTKPITAIISGDTYYEDIHRISYLLSGRPIGKGLEVVSSCRQPRCIRHLKLVDQNPIRFTRETYEMHSSRSNMLTFHETHSLHSKIPFELSELGEAQLRIVLLELLNYKHFSLPHLEMLTIEQLELLSLARCMELVNSLTYKQLKELDRIEHIKNTNITLSGAVDCARELSEEVINNPMSKTINQQLRERREKLRGLPDL